MIVSITIATEVTYIGTVQTTVLLDSIMVTKGANHIDLIMVAKMSDYIMVARIIACITATRDL